MKRRRGIYVKTIITLTRPLCTDRLSPPPPRVAALALTSTPETSSIRPSVFAELRLYYDDIVTDTDAEQQQIPRSLGGVAALALTSTPETTTIRPTGFAELRLY